MDKCDESPDLMIKEWFEEEVSSDSSGNASEVITLDFLTVLVTVNREQSLVKE